MNADEVVIHHVKHDRVSVVLDLFREGIRQPSEPAHMHPHRKVVALGIRCRDVRKIGLPLDPLLTRSGAFCGAVAALCALGSRAIHLDQHGIVNIRAERALDRLEVCLVPVRCELNPVSEPRAQIVHEPHGALAIATADEIRNNQLRVGLDRGPRPGVAGIGQGSLRRRDVFFLRVGEGCARVRQRAACACPHNMTLMLERQAESGNLNELSTLSFPNLSFSISGIEYASSGRHTPALFKLSRNSRKRRTCSRNSVDLSSPDARISVISFRMGRPLLPVHSMAIIHIKSDPISASFP